MSEKENKEEKNKENSKDTKDGDERKAEDIIENNITLMRSKIVQLEKDVNEKDALIQELTEKLNRATEFIEGDQKKMLLAEIEPKVETPKEILMLKDIDELMKIKETLDVARYPTMRSGRKLTYEKKNNPRHELDTVFDKYMAKIRGEVA